jgi:hypothetical protein
MKHKSPRFSRTVEFLKTHPEAVGFFQPYYVYIYQGDCLQYWRPHATGHTYVLAEAGAYKFAECWHWLSGIGPEKKLHLEIVNDVDARTMADQYKKHVKKEKEKPFDNPRA